MSRSLPRRYRWAIATLVLGACVVAGLWVGANPAVPVVAQVGLTIGLLAGVPLAWLVGHQSRRAVDPGLRTQHRPR